MESRKCEILLGYIVVIFGIKDGYMMLDDLFNQFKVIWMYTWNGHNLGFWTCMSVVGFWIKCNYLDKIKWIMGVGYVIGLKIVVMWILPTLVNYEKFHM